MVTESSANRAQTLLTATAALTCSGAVPPLSMLVPDDLRGRVMMAVDSDDVACPCVLQAVGNTDTMREGRSDAWYR